ncbi:hypothetical protein PG995_004094 [Apiospora arundinis]
MSDPTNSTLPETAAALTLLDVQTFNTELWTLYSLGVAVTALRTYSRIHSVGLADLKLDDYIVWLSVGLYTARSIFAHLAVNHSHGLANNGMTDDQRHAIELNSLEYDLRVFGAKMEFFGLAISACLHCSLKLAVLIYIMRLTYWQIVPDPGKVCHGVTHPSIVWATMAGSVLTDIWLMILAMPMLWGTRMCHSEKLAFFIVLGVSMVVVVCSVLKAVYTQADPINSAKLVSIWGMREAFALVLTTNLPMILQLLKLWFRLLICFISPQRSTGNPNASYFDTFNYIDSNKGVGSYGVISRRCDRPTLKRRDANLPVSESGERILSLSAEIEEVQLHDFNVSARSVLFSPRPLHGILVSNEIQVRVDRTSQILDREAHDALFRDR